MKIRDTFKEHPLALTSPSERLSNWQEQQIARLPFARAMLTTSERDQLMTMQEHHFGLIPTVKLAR